MAANNFKPFATAANANVTSQSDYEALAALLSGFQSGKASSSQINKALRQATTIAAVIAQFTADKSTADVLDNGDVATIGSNFALALRAFLANANPNFYTDSGSANNIIISPSPAATALTDGQSFDISCAAANTGAVTLKVSALNAFPVNGSAGPLQGGEIGGAKGVIRVVWSASKNVFLLTSQNTSGPVQVAPAAKPFQAPQLAQVLQIANNLSEISSAGSSAVNTALNNLGLTLRGEAVFTGSTSWTCPANVTTIYVDATAAGGGGGYSASGTTGGGGGGGGQGVINYAINVVPGTTYAITIGTPGAGGNSSSVNGVQGGNTAFDSLLNLTGGYGGLSNSTAGAAGGSGGLAGTGGAINNSISFGGAGGGSLFGPGGAGGSGAMFGSIPGMFGGGGGGGGNGNGARGAFGIMKIRW